MQNCRNKVATKAMNIYIYIYIFSVKKKKLHSSADNSQRHSHTHSVQASTTPHHTTQVSFCIKAAYTAPTRYM